MTGSLNHSAAKALDADLNNTQGGEVVHVTFADAPAISAGQAAEYLGAMLAELRGVAVKSNLKLLAALLEVAEEEAKLQAERRVASPAMRIG